MKYFHLAFLTFLLVVSTMLFRAHQLINWDAGQFALGTVHYSLADHSPHPPGYFLFVMAGKSLDGFFHDINLSFIVLVAATALAAILLYYFLALEALNYEPPASGTSLSATDVLFAPKKVPLGAAS